jgi:hypothetical protein
MPHTVVFNQLAAQLAQLGFENVVLMAAPLKGKPFIRHTVETAGRLIEMLDDATDTVLESQRKEACGPLADFCRTKCGTRCWDRKDIVGNDP